MAQPPIPVDILPASVPLPHTPPRPPLVAPVPAQACARPPTPPTHAHTEHPPPATRPHGDRQVPPPPHIPRRARPRALAIPLSLHHCLERERAQPDLR
ncbi:hypothetical protein FOMPIDRAFT_1056858, partial [Fomitopsis schrenkii]